MLVWSDRATKGQTMSPIELFWTAKKEANGEKLWDLDDTPGKLQRYIPQKNGDPSYNMFTLRANAFFLLLRRKAKEFNLFSTQ